MRSLISFLVAWGLMASFAQAQVWTTVPDGTGPDCQDRLKPTDFCYFRFTAAAAADSPLIAIHHLGDACFDPELGGTGTGAATVAIQKCQDTTVSANTCNRITVDVDGDGDVDDGILTGDNGVVSAIQRMCIYDLGPGHYFVEVITDPNGADTAIVALTGH